MDRAASGAAIDPDAKDLARAAWALGDYHAFARRTVWELGPVLVAACGIGPGDRVLDVAAGSGNVAIRAAEAGAQAVASDLVPENLAAGRAEALARGVELDWVEADAEALPFRDGEFDAVTSCFGAMFPPDHARVAGEIARVCRPGGTMGLMSFTPDGLGGKFFELFARFGPAPPPDALPPTLWGEEEHVRELFGDRVEVIRASRHEYVERADTPAAYVELFHETFGPFIALRGALSDRPERVAALDQALVDFAEGASSGEAGGPVEYRYEYLLVVARKRATGDGV